MTTPELATFAQELTRSGATVHVVSAAASFVLARQKRIDAAFIGFSLDADTVELCEHLRDLGVSQIVVAPADAAVDHTAHRGVVPLLRPLFLGIENSRRTYLN